jgi:hypothetical protein
MNKKMILGTAALTTVVVGGYLYYRWVRNESLSLFLGDDTEERVVMNDEILNDMARRKTPSEPLVR